MMRATLTTLVAACFALVLSAEEPPKQAAKDGGTAPRSEASPQQDSPLVRAAKAAQKARAAKASTGRAITDDSVRKSTGRITILSEGKAPGATTPEDAEAALVAITKDRDEAAKQAEQARREIEELEKEIARLEKELASIEESFYDESDVELREDLPQRNFAKTKADLERAREKLAEARKRHEALARASSNVIRR
jgi:chromosome segregation ATPase